MNHGIFQRHFGSNNLCCLHHWSYLNLHYNKLRCVWMNSLIFVLKPKLLDFNLLHLEQFRLLNIENVVTLTLWMLKMATVKGFIPTLRCFFVHFQFGQLKFIFLLRKKVRFPFCFAIHRPYLFRNSVLFVKCVSCKQWKSVFVIGETTQQIIDDSNFSLEKMPLSDYCNFTFIPIQRHTYSMIIHIYRSGFEMCADGLFFGPGALYWYSCRNIYGFDSSFFSFLIRTYDKLHIIVFIVMKMIIMLGGMLHPISPFG